ncbi:MAG: precorrin-2 C(20)-methyltransferase [Magnetococcales bacterium]|nr:precorrin-2 C(20)-methyltransferase [Magnetococcales bacterium]
MTTTVGKLIGVSLGPGNPQWLTRAAWSLLSEARCWAWPVAKVGGESYARAILERAGLAPPPRTLVLHFPMIRDRRLLEAHWRTAAEASLAILREGIDLPFLVEGDASFYATFRHLERAIRELDPTIRSEVIPGVASPLAAAALSGRALCDGEESLAIVPATIGLERLERLLTDFEIVVLMKVRPMLAEVITLLERRGLSHKAIFVERAGTPEERVVTDLGQLKDQEVHYLSLLIVHSHDGEAALGMRGT